MENTVQHISKATHLENENNGTEVYAREIINLMAREERKKFRKLFYFGGKSDKYAKKPFQIKVPRRNWTQLH